MVAIQSSAINVPPLSIVKMRETSRFQSRNLGIRLDLFILILAYEGHIHSQSRGRGQIKIFWAPPQTPRFFAPSIKIPGGATGYL